jgi:hypothetical protein
MTQSPNTPIAAKRPQRHPVAALRDHLTRTVRSTGRLRSILPLSTSPAAGSVSTMKGQQRVEGVDLSVVDGPQRRCRHVTELVDGLDCSPQRPLRVEDRVGGPRAGHPTRRTGASSNWSPPVSTWAGFATGPA